jgi:hypothetical protein
VPSNLKSLGTRKPNDLSINNIMSIMCNIRERPFNLKGGLWVFFFLNILIPNVAEQNILILMEEKNNNLIQSFCHIT